MIDSDGLEDDFEYSRKVYLDLIATGQEALQNMLDVADETAHPRSYEVLSGMIKNISDVNDRLMDIHKKRKDIKKKDQSANVIPNQGNTTNNLFVGSTTDLQRMILNTKEIENSKVIDLKDYKSDE